MKYFIDTNIIRNWVNEWKMNENKIETEAHEYRCITNKVVQNNSFENIKKTKQ